MSNLKKSGKSDKGLESAERVVAVKASKEISKNALVWALTHVVQSGDCITIIVVMPSQSSGRKLWGFLRFAGDCTSGHWRSHLRTTMYRKLEPAGSPFTRLAQVAVAAYRKRKVGMVEDARMLYENDEMDAPICLGGKLIHTKQFRSLQGNKLTGHIPPAIGLMHALAVLDLSYNILSGPVPPIFGNLTYTEKLYLQGNKLTDPFPPDLGNMTSLHYLELSDIINLRTHSA